VHTLLQQAAAAQSRTGLSGRRLCPRVGLSRATFCRWRQRRRCGQLLLLTPGPAKTGPLPLALLRAPIQDLTHGRRRTQGTGPLYQQHRQGISRRTLGDLVRQARRHHHEQLRLLTQHITWFRVQTVWALDATEWRTVPTGAKLQVLATSDLASRYGLGLQPEPQLTGDRVAEHLLALIRQHGPPLFLKRDNGSVLRTEAVQAVLAQAGILPLDSPPYYPPYNGAIENYIGQVKRALPEGLPCPPSGNLGPVRACLHGVRLELNARSRAALDGACPADLFHQGPRLHVAKPERAAIFDWIWQRTQRTLSTMETVNQRRINAAWRHTAESWLRSQGLMAINYSHPNTANKNQLLPLFFEKWPH
jgi:transposase InsO family protein